MDSSLSPREIQSRIRNGESVAKVAEAAGVPEEKITTFTAPVLAERAYIANQAKNSLVRRRGDSTSQRTLLNVLTDRLQARRLDANDLEWDSYRLPDRTWRVIALLQVGDLIREAWFNYDPRGRHASSDNADARWMLSEEAPAGASADEENTVDLTDEFALVRATSEPKPTRATANKELEADGLDEYLPAELTEVDGLYDIVGPKKSQLDELYDMLSGISEDSVRIYEGLSDVVIDENLETDADSVPTDETSEVEVDQVIDQMGLDLDDDEDPGVEPPVASATTKIPEPGIHQDALIEEPDESAKTKPTSRRKKRASVPAWDDILFGGPRPAK